MTGKPQKLTAEQLRELTGLDDRLLDQLALWANKNLTCAHCGKCTLRCEVLKGPALDMGRVEADFQAIMAHPEGERAQATIDYVTTHPETYIALRRCCFCGFCTAQCQRHMLAPERMREWRLLFMQAGYMPPGDSTLVMVDNEWNIFSAYRAIYGIAYPEFASLDWAATVPGTYDTLFFPGCSLVSYAPELTRKIGAFLTACGVRWAMSDACCGSPLMSAGMFDRAAALRQGILEKMRAAGITRMVTVCPGCGEEFAETFDGEISIVPLPELLAEHQGELAAQLASASAEGEGAERDGALRTFGAADAFTYSVFDSCHDRADGRHGAGIRALLAMAFPQATMRELDHHGRDGLCCGAGGAVSGYDAAITRKRIQRVVREGNKSGCDVLVTMCPTCTYTLADEMLKPDSFARFEGRNYLELLFDEPIDWKGVFDRLSGMWTGEWAAWLASVFF